MALEGVNETVMNFYTAVVESIPDRYKVLVNLVLLTILVIIYSIIVWKLYKFLSKRDILQLNLSKYNRSTHAFYSKIYASFLFIVEYIVITPVLVIVWFGFFALFLILLSKGIAVSQILLISAAMVAAIRLASYFEEDLSQDLAKLFPFNALAIVLLEPNVLNLGTVISRFIQVPSLFGEVLVFVGFIVALEILLRFGFTLIDFWQSEEVVKKDIPRGAFPKPRIIKIERKRR